MSGVVDDISSVFDDVGSTVSGWFGDGASDAASDATSAASSAASDVTDAADTNVAGLGSAANDIMSSGGSIADQTASAAYTVGMSTGTWGNDAIESSDGFASFGASASADGSVASDIDANSPIYTNSAIAAANYGPDNAMTGMTSGAFSPDSSLMSTSTNANGGIPTSSTGYGVVYSGSPTSGANASGGLLSSVFGGTGSGASSLASLGQYQLVGGLLGSLISAGGAYLASKPKPPANFSGRTPGGGGGGLGMHTTAGGFGLAAGGTEAAPTGPPSALQVTPASQQLNLPTASPGAALSAAAPGGGSAAPSPSSAQPANIGQTVANQAGVGGLVPQGAVNYMQQGGMGNG